MKRVLAPFLVIALIFVSLLPKASFVVPVQTQTEFSVWTDKPVYSVGETVIIQVSPAIALGAGFWLVIYSPDGSAETIHLTPGQGTVSVTAGPQTGQYRVELWAQIVVENPPPPELAAGCTYEAVISIQQMWRATTICGKLEE